MVASMEPVATKFSNLPNFRMVETTKACPSAKKGGCLLYRSSRPDYLTPGEARYFAQDVGIKCIIDFRSPREYRKAEGQKLLDYIYPLYEVKLPRGLKYKPSDRVQFRKIQDTVEPPINSPLPLELKTGEENTTGNKHVLLNFFKHNYIWAIYSSSPWYIQLYSLLFLIVDLVLNTGFKHFVRLFARHVLNKKGLCGQYEDMLTYSQASLCAAMKLMTERENFPMMINCAHGKDRTGLVSMLVLGCLGASSDYIAKDYARSQLELAPIKDRVYKEIVTKFHMSESFTFTLPETMLKTMEFIEKNYGSVTNYLEFIGFGPEDQKKLRENFLG